MSVIAIQAEVTDLQAVEHGGWQVLGTPQPGLDSSQEQARADREGEHSSAPTW